MELTNWEQSICVEARTGSEAPCRVYSGRLGLRRRGEVYEGGICVCSCPLLPRETLVRSLLHAKEQQYFDGLAVERRKKSYFVGRFAAKKAMSVLTNEKPIDIHIENGVFSNPVINSAYTGGRFEISIAHSADLGVAIAFPSIHPMGIDIEQINPEKAEVIEKELTVSEIDLCNSIVYAHNNSMVYTMAWTIKESLSKTLKTGLMTPLYIYEISSIDKTGSVYISYFKYFGQYKTVSFVINNHVCSITCPKNTTIEMDMNALFNFL